MMISLIANYKESENESMIWWTQTWISRARLAQCARLSVDVYFDFQHVVVFVLVCY